jgi:hypothetical protein
MLLTLLTFPPDKFREQLHYERLAPVGKAGHRFLTMMLLTSTLTRMFPRQ